MRLPVSIVIAQRTVTGPDVLNAEVVLTGNGDRKLQVVRWGSAYLLQTLRELYFWK